MKYISAFISLSRSILLIILGMVLIGTAAKSQGFTGGLMVGGSVGQITGDEAFGYRKIGLTAGVRAGYDFQSKLSLEMELLFNQKGSKPSKREKPLQGDWVISLNYFEIPVLVGYKDWLSEAEDFYHLVFYTGASYGYLFSTTFTNQKYGFVQNELKKHDFSFILGTHYYINSHLGLTGRYERSINKLWKKTIPDDRFSNFMLPYQFNLCLFYMF